MAWYVESKYDEMRASKAAKEAVRRESLENKIADHDEGARLSDMLDVKNMERSLDKKYSSMKS